MRKPSAPKYVAKGPLAKQILEDIQTPATNKEIEVMRHAIASRKKNQDKNK